MSKVSAALPSKIWIGSHEFPIRVVPSDHAALEGADGIAVLDADDPQWGIWIRANMTRRLRFDRVWHEITHCINFVNDLGMDDDGNDCAIATEEEIATAHGKTWTQVLLDNPAFERWVAFTLKQIRRERSKGHDNQPETRDDSATERQSGAGSSGAGQETRDDSSGGGSNRNTPDDAGSQGKEGGKAAQKD
jgi:hypothetical protein